MVNSQADIHAFKQALSEEETPFHSHDTIKLRVSNGNWGSDFTLPSDPSFEGKMFVLEDDASVNTWIHYEDKSVFTLIGEELVLVYKEGHWVSDRDMASITEDGAPTLTFSGELLVTDTDAGESSFEAETLAGNYGSLTIDAAGQWSYSADSSQAAIQGLGEGDVLTDTITVRSVDGSTQNIQITINGTNDVAVIAGTATGAVTEEDGISLTANGVLSVTDTDLGESSFTAETITGTYGELTIDADGNWAYSADNTQASIQSLGNGDVLTETLTVKSLDGTTQNVHITINGSNDAAVISGASTGAVTEDDSATLTVSGALSVTDVDAGESSFTAETITGTYGALTCLLYTSPSPRDS